MDPITQGALGAAVALAATSSLKADKKHVGTVALAGWIGGMAPDLDVFIQSSTDPLLALEFHRHFTHSLIFIPLGGALVALFLMALLYLKNRRDENPSNTFWNRTIFVASIFGWATHGLLDACTSYGTQLLWPFSNLRVAWNNVGIIDPIPTGLWLAATFLALKKFSPFRTRLFTCLGILYLGIGVLQRDRAFDVQTQIIADRGLALETIERRVVKPTVLQLFLWRSIYKTGDRFYADGIYIGPFGGHRVYSGESAKVLTHPALSSQAPRNRFEMDLLRFSWFSDGWLSDTTPEGSGVSRVGDVRYAFLPQEVRPLWGIVFDPLKLNEHVMYETFREIRPGDTSCFFRMMAGLDCETINTSEQTLNQ